MNIELPPGNWQVEIVRPVSIYAKPDRERAARRSRWRRPQAADRPARCPSCEHRAEFHQPDGCWYSITDAKPGTTVGCNCIGWTPS